MPCSAARLILVFLLAHFLAVDISAAEPRTALVIGNSAYAIGALDNPVNDATDVAAALRGAGFEVILKTDANQRGIKEAARAFGATLKSRGGTGLFYFAGHGVQIGGENYVVPVGEDIASEANLKAHSVTATEVVDGMTAARSGLNIVILDACRDNPLKTGTRGLSRMDTSANLFVSFSTSPGELALDGSGRNSPYTKHLAQAIGAPNLSLEETFKRTLKGVYQETRGRQTPWMSSSFFGDFVFRETAPAVVAPPTPATVPRPVPPRQLTVAPPSAGVYRAEGSNPDGSRYRGIVALAPAGSQVRFMWWIGKQVFSGLGQYAGRMLVVKWGQKHPVVYTFGHDDALDGEWADGTATEQLTLFARAADASVPLPDGRYEVSGRNPDGSTYAGAVSIARQGTRYRLDWTVGRSRYSGTGVREGNLLAVDWGSSTPVVYALRPDGTLSGLWASGRGEETLTPER
jgi:hypothetical protein